MAQIAWPAAGTNEAEFITTGIEPYRPGRVATEPGLTGRPHIIEGGRRYWQLTGQIAQTDDEELAGKITQALSAAQVGTEDWLPFPLILPSFAAGGASGGTKNGAITVTSVFQAAGGVVGIKLSPANPGEADAVNGVLRRAPRVGDFFIVVSDGVERIVQVSGWATESGESYGVLDFEEDLQLEIAVGDVVKAPSPARFQVDGDAESIRGPDDWGPWDISGIEYIPDPLASVMPQPLDRQYDLPNRSGRVGDTLALNVSRAWTDRAGGEISHQVQATGGIDVVPGSDGQYSLELTRAGRYEVVARATSSEGLSDEQSFEVTISERTGNRGPRLDAIVPVVSLTVGGDDVQVDATGHISDPDPDDELTFTAVAAEPTIVGVRVNGDIVTLTGKIPGRTTVVLTGTDSSNRSISTEFEVSVGAIETLAPGLLTTRDRESGGLRGCEFGCCAASEHRGADRLSESLRLLPGCQQRVVGVRRVRGGSR